ncbi:MAG: hypothetical protein ACJAV7_000674, partial [Flavobacteriales bacterium]
FVSDAHEARMAMLIAKKSKLIGVGLIVFYE